MDPETPAAPVGAPGTYPVRIELDAPYTIARWRVFVHYILAIPHLLIMYALNGLQSMITIIAFFAILFTKTYPEGLFKVSTMCLRYQWRVMTYLFWGREAYPPFEFETVLQDPGTDPAKLSIDYPGEMNRWLPLVKWLLAIPHLFMLVIVGIGAVFVWFVAFFAILFTGRFPEGMRNYLVGVARWGTRVAAYIHLMTDQYPPFSLE